MPRDFDALVEREARAAWLHVIGPVRNEAVALAARLKSDLNQRLGTLGLRITRCHLQLSAAA